jgi:hypothetical protein
MGLLNGIVGDRKFHLQRPEAIPAISKKNPEIFLNIEKNTKFPAIKNFTKVFKHFQKNSG